MVRLTLVILALIVGAYSFSSNRMDNSEMESDSLVRMARAASSSSEEDKKEQIADKDLKKITPENNSDEITEGSGQRETRQIQTAEPVQEGSGSLWNENSDLHPLRTVRDSDLEASGQEPNLRVLKDLPLEASGEEPELRTLRDSPAVEGSGLENSRFFTRLADSPLKEGSGDEASGHRVIRSESSEIIETTDLVERDVEGSGLSVAESVDAPAEGSGDILPTRFSRDVAVEGSGLETAESLDAEGSGELLSSQHVRVIREEGSGLTADE